MRRSAGQRMQQVASSGQRTARFFAPRTTLLVTPTVSGVIVHSLVARAPENETSRRTDEMRRRHRAGIRGETRCARKLLGEEDRKEQSSRR